MDIKAEVKQLIKTNGPGKMSNTAYDTAWVARLGEIDWDLSSRALAWLDEHQLPDGSWGTEQPFYYHDRVVCTLSAMIALTYRGRRARDKQQIEKGLEALERITTGATSGLAADPNGATVGFEMIIPTLVSEAERLGIIKQQGDRILGRLGKAREVKMNKLAGIKISRNVTVAHSVEMAGTDKIDLLDIDNLQEKNGSVGNSPSATAYFAQVIKPGDVNALNYLKDVIDENGGTPTLAPFETFEKIWVLWNLSLAKLNTLSPDISKLYQEKINSINELWNPDKGLRLSQTYSITDSDDTAVGYELLMNARKTVDIKALLSYEEEHWFRCFHFEANPSVDVNIHAIGALRISGFEKDHPIIKKTLAFIRSKRQLGKYWFDKWHVSPYYTTSHVVIYCQGFDDQLCEESIKWILETQKADGSWGFYNFSTTEETAYCIQALHSWRAYGKKVPAGRIEAAGRWLNQNLERCHPPLWIDKSLYSPNSIVKAVILSALQLATE